MAGRGKASHVEADLGDEDAGDGLADARPGDQSVDGGAKGDEGVAQPCLHRAHGPFKGFTLGEMQLQQEAVVGRDASVQGGDEVRPRGLDAAAGQLGQAFRIRLTRHQGLQDGAAAHAQDVAEDRRSA